MLDLNEYPLFQKHQQSLRELSKDDSNPQNIQYMTDSMKQAVDFDKVKEVYEQELGLSGEHASSVDAISCTSEEIVFIEFKNGNMKNEKAKVKEKLRDSLLIFGGICEKTISYMRQNVEFVLVYNEEKNPLPNQYTKGMVRPSPSRNFISKRLAQMGKEEFILFDLGRYKKLYFKDVHTYTQEEFENYLEKLK